MDSKILREATLAYQAVYDENLRQELAEEQVWEQVESWVNSLLEEGYDLSEYTWEEMYEAYLNEAPMTAFQAAGGQAKLDQLNKGRSGRQFRFQARDIEKQGQDNLYRAGGGDAARAQGPTRNQNVRGGGTVKVPTLTRQDIINRGTVAAAKPKFGTTPPKPAPTGAAKPAPTTPPKPAPTATAKPTPPAPAAAKPTAPTPPKPGTQAAGPESIKPKTPNPLMQRTFGYQTGNAPDQIAKASAGVSKEKSDAAFAKTKEDIKTKLKPSPNLNMSLDLFDIVKGHLLDEGYADTEEAALAIMANMSEDWKQSIVEIMSPAMQKLTSNRLGGKISPASGGGQSSTSGAARPAQPQRPQPPGGLTPMQRLQRRPEPIIR